MNPITRPLALASLFALAAASSARAEDPPAKAEVTLKANPGKPAYFVFSHETKQEIPRDGKKETNTASGMTEFSIELKARGADGTGTGVVRFGRMSASISNTRLRPMTFDSADAPRTDARERLMAIAVLGLAQNEFPVTLDAGGAITKVDGLTAAIDAAAKRLGADDQEKVLLETCVTEDAVKQIVAWALVATPLPPGTMTAGQTWDDTDAVPGTPRGTSIQARRKLAVTAVSAESVQLSGTGTLDVKAPARGAEPTITATTCAATVEVSRADGLPLWATASLSLSADLPDGRGSMSQEMTSKTDRVKEWPSAKPDVTLPPTPAQPEKPGTPGAPAGK